MTGTDIPVDFGEHQIIAGRAALLLFERLAVPRWLRRQLPAGSLLVP
jgi:hypothetical protein